jgi:Spy/CpxP family protein refolding chaperone
MMELRNAIGVLAIAAAVSFAQGPGWSGNAPDPAKRVEMRVNRLTNVLSLTETQKAQATKIFTEAQTAVESARTGLQTTHQSMTEAVKANNTANIEALANSIGTYTAQITAAERKADAALYALLTAEQKTKFEQIMQRRPGRMGPGGMGPGGMGRGPRGMGEARTQ